MGTQESKLLGKGSGQKKITSTGSVDEPVLAIAGL